MTFSFKRGHIKIVGTKILCGWETKGAGGEASSSRHWPSELVRCLLRSSSSKCSTEWQGGGRVCRGWWRGGRPFWAGGGWTRPVQAQEGRRDSIRDCHGFLSCFLDLKALHTSPWFYTNNWANTDLNIGTARTQHGVREPKFPCPEETSGFLLGPAASSCGHFGNAVPWDGKLDTIGLCIWSHYCLCQSSLAVLMAHF